MTAAVVAVPGLALWQALARHSQRLWRLAVVAGMALWLAGCVTPTSLAPDADPDALQRVGRFSVLVLAADGSRQAVQGGFRWRDGPQGVQLSLHSPLGAALAQLDVAPNGQARLEDAEGNVTTAASPDDLLTRIVGAPVPVSALRYWLRGTLPAEPAAECIERDAAGALQVWCQSGWRAQATAHDERGPTRLRLRREEPTGASIDVRLVADTASAP